MIAPADTAALESRIAETPSLTAHTLRLTIIEPFGNRYEVTHKVGDWELIQNRLNPSQVMGYAIDGMRDQLLSYPDFKAVLADRADKAANRIADLEERLFRARAMFYAVAAESSGSGIGSIPTDAEIWAEVRNDSPLTRNAHEDLAALTAAVQSVLIAYAIFPEGKSMEDAINSLHSLAHAQAGEVVG